MLLVFPTVLERHSTSVHRRDQEERDVDLSMQLKYESSLSVSAYCVAQEEDEAPHSILRISSCTINSEIVMIYDTINYHLL